MKSLIQFGIVWIILFVLNVVFPPQTDDIVHYLILKDRPNYGFLTSYFEWNGRFFEQVWFYFFAEHIHSVWFDIINSLVGTCFIFTFYFLLFMHFPNKKSDYVFFSLICIMTINMAFATVFLWGAGSLNYLWAMETILVFLIPYRFFWNACLNEKNDILSIKYKKLFILLLSIVGIIAGWSSEHVGAITCFVLLVSLIYLYVKKIKIPTWYYVGVFSFLIGWIILFVSPGSATRGEWIASSSSVFSDKDFVTIREFFSASIVDQIMRINTTLNSSCRKSFGFFLLVLIWFFIWKKKYAPRKSIFLGILFSSIIVIVYFAIKCSFALLLYILTLIILSLLAKQNKKYFLFLGLFVVWLMIGLTLIQFHGQVGLRARMGEGILLATMVVLMFREFYFGTKHQAMIEKGVFSILVLSVFLNLLNWGYYGYRWHKIVEYIQQEKERGNFDIVVDRNNFYSFYDKDFGEVGEDKNVSTNKEYARYFGIKSFSVK